MKIMKDPHTGKTMKFLLLDGLASILEVKELSQAFWDAKQSRSKSRDSV